MNTVGDYLQAIDQIAPFHTAESWDNVGLIVGGKNDSANCVLLALDVTKAVLDEAVALGVDLIITHHPLMFSPIQQLSSGDIVYQMAAHGIGLISAHTNLDMAPNGVNESLAKQIGLTELTPLKVMKRNPYYTVTVFVESSNTEAVYTAMKNAGAGDYGQYTGCAFVGAGVGRFLPEDGSNPTIGIKGSLEMVKESRLEMVVHPSRLAEVLSAMKNVHSYEQPSFQVAENSALTDNLALGCVGVLERPVSSSGFALLVKERLGAVGVRYLDNKKEIRTVALCSGSGGKYLKDAISLGVDAYLTGEIDHNYILDAGNGGITLVEAGHFATETVVMKPLKDALEKQLQNTNIRISEGCTDGMQMI